MWLNEFLAADHIRCEFSTIADRLCLFVIIVVVVIVVMGALRTTEVMDSFRGVRKCIISMSSRYDFPR